MWAMLREALGQAWLLSVGRDTRPHGVGHGSTRGSDHSRWDWASHGGESPPLRGHHCHLSSIWYCWRGCWLCFEDMMVPCRPPGLTREVADHSSNSQCPAPQFNMTGVANLVISMELALGACLLLSRSIGTCLSRKTLPNKLSGFRIIRRTRLSFKNPLKISAAGTRQRNNKCSFCWSWSLQSLNTQDKGERLQRQKATCHPPGIPDEIACIPHQWAFQCKHRTF